MSKHFVTIDQNTIDHIELYINSGKKSLDQIKKSTGADYIINGTLYNSTTFKPVMNFKANGTVYSIDGYQYWGYAWDSNNFGMRLIPDNNYTNYICGTQLITLVGGKCSLTYPTEVGGRRPRTAIGTIGTSIVLFCADDLMSPEDLRDYMFQHGCNSAIMLDSGGSTQCNLNGTIIKADRKVQNYILVYKKKENQINPPEIEGDNKMTIIQDIMKENKCYKNNIKRNKKQAMLHSTGTPGAMKNAIRNNMNNASATTGVEFIIDNTGVYQTLPLGIHSWHAGTAYSGGPSANTTHVSCEICEPVETRLLDINWKPISKGSANNTSYAVTCLQKELTARGYDVNGIDGSFGPGLDKALRKFQTDNKISVDGSCGPASMKILRNRNGSFMQYDVVGAANYFNTVYDYAVELYAYLMKQFGSNPVKDIICHSEGNKLGIASAHADVMHWFPSHGKSMDIFRKDVADCMAGIYKKPIKPVEPVVDEVDLAVDKLVKAGVISDGEYWKNLYVETLSKNVPAFVGNVEALIMKMAAKL